MNNIFRKQKQFLDTLETTLLMELEQSINSFGFVLKDYVINKQLFREGIDGDGEKLVNSRTKSSGYARTTIRLKIRKGDPVDRITLRDEGDFYRSINIDAFADRFEITSDVDHDEYIVKRYGRNVLKVTNENFREFMNNYFVPNLKKQIDGKFAK